MPSNPRTKRPYQPTLDTYVHRSTALSSHPPSSPPSLPPIRSSETSWQPPNTIQNNLLSVGMRIRKAIPSGYQTQKELKPSYSHSTTKPLGESNANALAYNRANELAPICGIDKIGALGMQTYPSVYGQEDGHDLFSLSQTSSVSAVSTLSKPIDAVQVEKAQERKRRWKDDDGDADCEDDSVFAVARPKMGARGL